MKKLLYVILPLLLFFGVSYGWSISHQFQWPSSFNSASTNVTSGTRRGIQITPTTTIVLTGLSAQPATNVTRYYIQLSWSDKFTFITSWYFTNYSVALNVTLTGNNRYCITVNNETWTYSAIYWPPNGVYPFTADKISFLWYMASTDWCFATWWNPTNYTSIKNLYYYEDTPPINIRYNGTWQLFTWTNIYLNWLYNNISYSGNDLVFTPWIYRIMPHF